MTHRKPMAINARTGEPLNADALPEHGGACWDAYCSGDCDLVKRAVAALQAVVNKAVDDITDDELAAAQEIANILLRAKRDRRCPDCDGEAGEAHVCAPLRDRLEASRAILKARTEEMQKALAENERLRERAALFEDTLLEIWNEGTGLPGCDAEYLAAKVLRDSGSIPDRSEE